MLALFKESENHPSTKKTDLWTRSTIPPSTNLQDQTGAILG